MSVSAFPFAVIEYGETIGRFASEALAHGFAAFYADEQMTAAQVYRLNKRSSHVCLGCYMMNHPLPSWRGLPNIVDRGAR